jgi:hypothetical protein
MKMIKLVPILVMICAISAGGFFAYKHFFQTKKTVSLSVTDLANDNHVAADANVEKLPDSTDQAIAEEVKAADEKAPSSNVVVSDKSNQSSVISHQEKAVVVNDKVSSTDNSKSSGGEVGKIVSELVSFGFQKSSSHTIKAVIIHTSYNALGGDVFDYSKVLQEWKDAGVSPHYAISRDGVIHQLVADQNIAWHAGVSKLPDGTTDVNGSSIGIEVVNSADDKFTVDQYAALNSLIATLKKKYEIKYVLGHDDIAAGRKSDPWGIDWKKVNK